MSTETNVKTVEADPNSLYRVQNVRVSSSKHFSTPIKAVDLHRLKQKFQINNGGRGFNEIFKRFNAEQINTFNEDSYAYSRLQSEFNSQKNRVNDAQQTTACFLEFAEQRMPTPEEIEFLVDTAYPNSDITPIPIVSYINKVEEHKKLNISASILEDYKKYLIDAIECINKLNNKPIMGVIPKIAPKKIVELVAIYQKHGINSFAMDLDGANPLSADNWIHKLLKTLKEQKLLDSSFIHGYNIGFRATKTIDVIPARDILGFGMGLDSIGDKHKKFAMNPKFFEQTDALQENKYRLFNKQDYGYWKAITPSQLQEQYPKDTKINLDLFSPQNKYFAQKLFNTEQLSLEALNVKNIITEDPEKSMNYLKSKKAIPLNDILIIEKLPKKISK